MTHSREPGTPNYVPITEKHRVIREMLKPVWDELNVWEYYEYEYEHVDLDMFLMGSENENNIILSAGLNDLTLKICVYIDGYGERDKDGHVIGRTYDVSDPTSIDKMRGELLDWIKIAKEWVEMTDDTKDTWNGLCRRWA